MKRVVVIDDDENMRELMRMILDKRYEVSSAVNGEAGLELVRRTRPDLVVLDLLMPKMHGFEVCRRLRADESLKGLKILISSSKSYRHDVRTALEETGADAYVVKPFELDDFMRQVRLLLGEEGPA